MRQIFYLGAVVIVSCNNPSADSYMAWNGHFSAADSAKIANSFLLKHPLMTWANKTPVEIGCWLQTEFSFKDSIYNCDNKSYTPVTDEKAKGYLYRLDLPDSLVSSVHPVIEEVTMVFEHGNLRDVVIVFKECILIDDVRQIFSLPEKKANFPQNVNDISYWALNNDHVNRGYIKWIAVSGFDLYNPR